MYLSFFGLNEKPFAITPDPRYLFLSTRHAEALAHLLYGIKEAGGFIQLTGEVGTGKTTIVRSLLVQTPKNAEIALILNPRMTAPEFLLTLCEELGIGVPDESIGSGKDLVDVLNDYLLVAHSKGRRVVLVVDEAQNLSPEVLEQVRLLTNLETNTQKLLQIILIGQPELRELLARNELRQLAQRITGRYHLDPLSAQETSAYVRHRLRVAGATADIFTPLTLGEVYRLSGGVPRLINVLCDRALLGAYTQDRHRVTPSLLRNAAQEVFGRRIAPGWLPWAATAATGVVLALSIWAAWQLMPWQHAGATAVAAATSPAVTATQSLESLAPLLEQYKMETDPDDAFGQLFKLWNVSYVAGEVDPCAQAREQGLECLVQRGSFGQLRHYNRPAILLLNDDAGGTHQIVVAALSNDTATIELGGKVRRISIAELSRYWFGDFVLLQRPGDAAAGETPWLQAIKSAGN
jgi:general secretion pathway protein A